MASVNFATREISCKIVYYGPGLSGKTTNLQVIHRKLPLDKRSDMVSLQTEQERTLFFDFLPLDLGSIKGFKTRFQLYTVPGQVFYNLTRKQVLRGVDGIVFVADSQNNRMAENMESLENLKQNLKEYGISIDDIPMVIQYNKRDLPDILDIETLQHRLNYQNWPIFEATAHNGGGVVPTLKEIAKQVIDKFNKKPKATTVPTEKPQPMAAQAPVSAPVPPVAPVSPPPIPNAAPSFSFQPPAPEKDLFFADKAQTSAKPDFDEDGDDDEIELIPYSTKKS
jgi:signal recognition particle receptor subunit beta